MPKHASTREADDLVPSKQVRLPLRTAILALSVAVAIVIGAVFWYFAIYRPGAVADRDRQVRNIVCSLADPSVPREESIRSTYECAAISTPKASRSSRSVKPTSSAAPTSARGGGSRTPAAAAKSTQRHAQAKARTRAPKRVSQPSAGHAAQTPQPAPTHPSSSAPTPKQPSILGPVLKPVCRVSVLGAHLC